MSSAVTSVKYIDENRGRGLVAEVGFNAGDSILEVPYDIAVLYSPFVRNTCYRCFASVIEPEEKEKEYYECTSCKHLVLCSNCVKDLVKEVRNESTKQTSPPPVQSKENDTTVFLTHPLLQAHQLACGWFCTLPESVREGDTDYLRFALQYGARALLGDTRLLMALGKLHTNVVQHFTDAYRFCESFAQLVVSTFAPHGYRVDVDHLCDVLMRTKCNSIGYPFTEEETLGWALQEEICMINHSCVPNAAVVRPKRTTATACCMELVARSPIKAGEEITIAYIDVDKYGDDVRGRCHHLMRDYGFVCRCAKCAPPSRRSDTSNIPPTKH